ncbi:Hsp70 family protein [Polymorphospora sp. NPDC051019]|uniref:Hsp70 family protein n=1 Tax=Polymorphospora sp. NPDC051019 TaxID=3155725 RepID=UPI00342C1FC4
MAGTTRAVGVDFGTSTSLVAEKVGRSPVEVVPLGRTARWFPSVAGYQSEALVVGEDAEVLPGDRVIRSVKRAITEELETLDVMGPRGVREVVADDVIVAVLSEIGRRSAAADLPLTTEGDIRLGCPAMWTGPQRARLLGLAAKAGLPISNSTLVDEPIAAGIAWVTHRFLMYGERPAGRLLVFDMGGGTLDIAVLDVEGGEHPEISVLSALGTAHAGDRLDAVVADELAADLAGAGVDVDGQAGLFRAHLLRAARETKVRLSTAHTHAIVLPRLLGRTPVLPYGRERLETAFRAQMDDAERLVWAALRAALLTERGSPSPDALRRMGQTELAAGVHYVLLAGGMSRVPYVERRIGALFPHAQIFDNAGVTADEAIVAGLADNGSYERLNLHRPGFDFVLEWQHAGQHREQTVYPAFTPFYEPWQVLNGQTNLGYEWWGQDFVGPGDGVAVFRVRSTSGDHLGLTFDGQAMDGFRVRLGRHLMVKLYCDGRILIRDGTGRAFDMRVDRWPVLRGRGAARLKLRSVAAGSPTPPTPWFLEKEWAPPPPRARRR